MVYKIDKACYPSGALKAEIPRAKNLEWHGVFREWWENGKLKRVTRYNYGKLDGVSYRWFENGNRQSVRHWKDDKPVGAFCEWLENGQVRMEGVYNDEHEILRMRLYDESGKLECEIC